MTWSAHGVHQPHVPSLGLAYHLTGPRSRTNVISYALYFPFDAISWFAEMINLPEISSNHQHQRRRLETPPVDACQRAPHWQYTDIQDSCTDVGHIRGTVADYPIADGMNPCTEGKLLLKRPELVTIEPESDIEHQVDSEVHGDNPGNILRYKAQTCHCFD